MNNEAGTPIRLGVVGLGVMGARTLAAAVRHPDYDVVYAADASPSALDAARAAHPGLRFTDSGEQVVSADDVDAVYIATPPATHAALAVAALERGTAVFCEKPLAVSLADGRRMAQAAARAGRANAVNFPFSDMGATLHLERALRSGELGRVLGVDVSLVFPVWPRPFQAGARWVGEREQGGFIREVFSHFAYLTDRLLGPIKAVEAQLQFAAAPADAAPGSGRGAETAARGLLRCGEIPVQVNGRAGVAGPETYDWTLWGEHRSYQLRDWRRLYSSDGGPWTEVELSDPATGAESSRLSLFAEAVRGGRPENLADFASALRVQEVVEAFHRG